MRYGSRMKEASGEPVLVQVAGRQVNITSPDKIFFPAVAAPKLDRISLRTTPLCVNTLAMPLALRLVPSPGNGPAVSLGITLQAAPLTLPDAARANGATAPSDSMRNTRRRSACMCNMTGKSCISDEREAGITITSI